MSYYIALDLPRDSVTGKRRQKKVSGFKTKKEAEAELALVCTRKNGRVIKPNSIEKTWGNITVKLLGKSLSFHDLRHLCATYLLRQGVHPKVVSEMLGHSDVTITLRIYSHVLPVLHDEASMALDRVFSDCDQTVTKSGEEMPKDLVT